jgi:hypothetical protein
VGGAIAVDLAQKGFEHRERPQLGAMVALAGLMLIEQPVTVAMSDSPYCISS